MSTPSGIQSWSTIPPKSALFTRAWWEELSLSSKVCTVLMACFFVTSIALLIAYGAGAFSAATPIPSATITAAPTSTPTPTVTHPNPVPDLIVTRFASVNIPPPTNDTFPTLKNSVTFPFPFATSLISVGIGGLFDVTPTQKLMNLSCPNYVLSDETVTGFNMIIQSCVQNGVATITPEVGFPTAALAAALTTRGTIAIYEVNSLPSIAFHADLGSSSYAYEFQLASSATGQTWNSPVTVFPVSSGAIEGVGLCVISGFPFLFQLLSDTGIYFARSSGGFFNFTSNVQFAIATYTLALQGPLSVFLLDAGAATVSCYTTAGSIAYSYATVANPNSSANFATFYLGSDFTRCGTINGIYPDLSNPSRIYPAYVTVSSNDIVFAVSSLTLPTSYGDFGTQAAAITGSVGVIPDSASIIRLNTISNGVLHNLPIIIWMSSSNIYFTVASNQDGSNWSNTAHRLDSTTSQTTFDVVRLPSGNIGVAYVTSTGFLKYVLIDGLSVYGPYLQSYATPIGSTSTNLNCVGVGVVNGIPCIASATSTSVMYIKSTANNELFSDSISVSYSYEGS